MNLSVTEIKEINKKLLEKSGIDFSDYSPIAYKNRLIDYIENSNLKSGKEFLSIIDNENFNIDNFLSKIAIPETEMFRDPAMWRELRDKILPSISSGFRIFLPANVTGEELITLLIILKEENLLEKAKITAGYFTKSLLNNLKNPAFSLKQMEINIANYKRYKGKADIYDYCTKTDINCNFSKLISNIKFIETKIFDDSKLPGAQDIVIYRNNIIYYNQKLQSTILNNISEIIKTGGYLITGTMENLYISENMKEYFVEISKSEKIYKKKA